MKKKKYIGSVIAVVIVCVFSIAYILALEIYRQAVNSEMKSRFDSDANEVYRSLEDHLDVIVILGAENEDIVVLGAEDEEFVKENSAVSIYSDGTLLEQDREIISEVVDSYDTPYFLTRVYDYKTAELVYAGDGSGIVVQEGENGWLPGDAEDLYKNSRRYAGEVSERIMPYEGNTFVEEIYGRIHGNYFFRGQKLFVYDRVYFVISAMYANPYNWNPLGQLILYGGLVILVLCIITAVKVVAFVRREKKRLVEEELRQNILTAIAHDVRGPITAISGYAENLLQTENGSEERHYINSILQNTLYMNDMITKLLDYIRMESIPEIRAQEVRLGEVAQELEKRYSNLLEERGLVFDIEGECIVRADSMLMEHMLENLLMNAIKYSSDGSIIAVVFEDKSFTVSNDMKQPIECKPDELWEVLKKGSNARTGRTGSGLGLPIVKRILEVSGFTGRIDVIDNRFTVKVDCTG